MTNDAKLGLLAGVAAVLLIAVVYHRRPQPDAPPAVPPAPKSSAALPPPSVSVSPRVDGTTTPDLSVPHSPADPLLRRPVE